MVNLTHKVPIKYFPSTHSRLSERPFRGTTTPLTKYFDRIFTSFINLQEDFYQFVKDRVIPKYCKMLLKEVESLCAKEDKDPNSKQTQVTLKM